MKNNNGFGTREILAVIVLVLAVCSFLGYIIIQGANSQKFTTMKNSGLAFSNAVSTNITSFHYTNVVYLKEALDEQVISNIKNPFGDGFCDATQSRVDNVDGTIFTTLKCGDYLIDKVSFNDMKTIDIIKVSDWSITKPSSKDVEERTLYNCTIDGKEIFDDYSDELLFVYDYNQKFGTDYYFAKDIDNSYCEVVSKEFYRTYELAN